MTFYAPRIALSIQKTTVSPVIDTGGLVDFEWSASDGADGYILWTSSDGIAWSRDAARFVEITSHRADGLDDLDGDVLFARVSAWSESNGESAPSDIYMVTSSSTRSRVLLVDGNDRYQADPAIENSAGLGHDFSTRYVAWAGFGLDTAANEHVSNGAVELANYDAVIWMLGEESTEHETLDATEQAILVDYLSAGGQLLISGAEIGWDLVSEGSAADAMFFNLILGSDYISDDAGSYAATGTEMAERVDFYNPGLLDVAFPDVIAPRDDGRALLSYEGGAATAAVLYETDDYRVVNVGFPIETIDTAAARKAFLDEVATIFSL